MTIKPLRYRSSRQGSGAREVSAILTRLAERVDAEYDVEYSNNRCRGRVARRIHSGVGRRVVDLTMHGLASCTTGPGYHPGEWPLVKVNIGDTVPYRAMKLDDTISQIADGTLCRITQLSFFAMAKSEMKGGEVDIVTAWGSTFESPSHLRDHLDVVCGTAVGAISMRECYDLLIARPAVAAGQNYLEIPDWCWQATSACASDPRVSSDNFVQGCKVNSLML